MPVKPLSYFFAALTEKRDDWNPELHPRIPKHKQHGGEFISKVGQLPFPSEWDYSFEEAYFGDGEFEPTDQGGPIQHTGWNYFDGCERIRAAADNLTGLKHERNPDLHDVSGSKQTDAAAALMLERLASESDTHKVDNVSAVGPGRWSGVRIETKDFPFDEWDTFNRDNYVQTRAPLTRRMTIPPYRWDSFIATLGKPIRFSLASFTPLDNAAIRGTSSHWGGDNGREVYLKIKGHPRVLAFGDEMITGGEFRVVSHGDSDEGGGHYEVSLEQIGVFGPDGQIVKTRAIEPMSREAWEFDDLLAGPLPANLQVIKTVHKRDAEHGHHIPGTPYKYKHGWVPIMPPLPKHFESFNPDAPDSLSAWTSQTGTLLPERRKLHQSIVNALLAGHRSQSKPIAIFLGGGAASGKSTLEHDNPADVVHIDADEIKAKLPEYQDMISARDIRAAAYVHEESSTIAKEIRAKATSRKLNFILDGTGDTSYQSMAAKVGAARKAGYTTSGKYVTVDTDTAYERALLRAKRTGRMIPESVFRAVHASVSDTFARLVKENAFDTAELWDNNGNKPVLIGSKKSGGIWTVFDQAAWERFLAKAGELVSGGNR